MAINKVPYPTTPVPVSDDWARVVNVLQTNYLEIENKIKIDFGNDNVLKGAVFNIGGAVYLADSDTAITGTASDYVKLTPGTSTATAAYVSSLSGVTWNDTYNGYYDVSGNLYVFNEVKARAEGGITDVQGRFVEHDRDGGIYLDAETEYGTARPLPARIAFRSFAYNYDNFTGPGLRLWQSIVWSSSLSLFVAVSSDGYVSTSPNGSRWTVRTPSAANGWNSVCWSPDLSLFVAVAGSGTNRVMTSPDGITWTGRTEAESNTWNYVCWSPYLGIFCAVAGDGTNRVMTSPDGITWTARSTGSGASLQAVAWSPELQLFVATGSAVSTSVLRSPDGINWSIGTMPGLYTCNSVCWSSELGLFCATALSNPALLSADGINWVQANTTIASSWEYVVYSEELGMFVAVAASGSKNIMTSVNGYDWSERFANGTLLNAVEWSPELGIFCVIDRSTITNESYISRRFI